MNVFELFASIRLDTSEYESNLNNAKGKFDDFSSNLKNAGESISNVGSTLTKNVTLPIVGLGAAVLKTGMDYEAGMSKVQAISGATGDEMAALGDKAMEMAAKTKFSTADSAEAYQYMAMAGWKAADMVDGLSGIMNLAAASGENLGTTSDIVTDAITAFGLTAADSGRFADVLATASNNANTNVSMLGESFKYVAPVAGALGYSVEDTSVALGLMANSGIKATNAGTALRTLLTNMSKPTKQMSDAMDVLGVSLTDDKGKMYSLMNVMEQLRAGFGGGSMSAEDFSARLGELDEQFSSGTISQEEYDTALGNLMSSMYGVEAAQKAELAAMLAGKEGMSGLLAIVNSSEEDFNKLTTAINNSNGTAEEMARIMQDNAAGAFERLKSAINVLFTQLSEHLIPIFTSVVEKVTEWVNWFGQLDAGTQKVILTIAGVAAALGPVLVAIGKIITAVGTIISTVSKIGPVLSGVKTAASALFAVLAANPIALVIAAVAALAAGFVALWNTSESFRNFWIGLWDGLKSVVSTAVDGILSFLRGVVDFFSDNWQSLLLMIANPFAGAFKLIYDNSEQFRNFWKGLLENIKSTIFSVVDGAKQWGKDLIDNFVGGIKSKISAVTNAVKSVAGKVKDFLGFSEPKEGPLSNFHTYAPDMMELFAHGIRENARIVQEQLDRSLNFDFGSASVGLTANYSANATQTAQSVAQANASGIGGTTVNIYSPVAVDAVQAAREWKQTTQRMAMAYV